MISEAISPADKISPIKVLLVLSLLVNAASLYFLFLNDGDRSSNNLTNGDKEIPPAPQSNLSQYSTNFSLLSPYIAQMAPDDFLERQEYFRASYYELKQRINNTFKERKFSFGVYFEDLDSGAWIGINEREKFIPASLMKIPVAAAIIKKSERNELSLNDTVTILQEDLDYSYGDLATKGYGYNMTIINLMSYMFYYSDNTALRALFRQIDDNDNIEAWMSLGIPYRGVAPFLSGTSETLFVSPKDYSNIFRTLYYSGYLKRRNSQLLLTLLSKTNFSEGLPAGVPEKITVSHKIGAFDVEGIAYHHDCGIVYEPHKPYIICVMTKGLSHEKSDLFIKNISRMVYDYITEEDKSNISQEQETTANETLWRTTGSGVRYWITG